MTNINFQCTVSNPYFDRNKKKYLILKLSDKDVKKVHSEHVKTSKFIQNQKIKNPLEGNLLEVKVPFRYNKISCKVSGDKTIQELEKDDMVDIIIEYCGVWNIGEWSGFAWKVSEIVYGC